MTYRIWKSGQDILIENADGRIVLSLEDIKGIVKDCLPSRARLPSSLPCLSGFHPQRLDVDVETSR